MNASQSPHVTKSLTNDSLDARHNNIPNAKDYNSEANGYENLKEIVSVLSVDIS